MTRVDILVVDNNVEFAMPLLLYHSRVVKYGLFSLFAA